MLKFFKCNHCGNVVIKAVDKGVPVVCCGETMTELKAGTVDASAEKHVPEVTAEGNVTVAKIGSIEHPMEKEHYIQFIALETEKGVQIKNLNPGDIAEAKFSVTDDMAVAVYELCNLHGLWKKEL